MVLPPKLARAGQLLERRIAPPFYRRTPIVTLSESSRSHILDRLRLPADNVHVVPPGIDPGFSPGTEAPDPTVVAVGRLMPSKDFPALLDAMAAVRHKVPNARLRIIGEGYERPNLERRIAELDAVEWCTIEGRVAPEVLLEAYRSAWIVASTSRAEGWGMTLTEAAACSTPAVATRIPGHTDAVVDNETGLLVDRDDELAPAMVRLLIDHDLRRRLAAAALDRSARFSWDRTAYRHPCRACRASALVSRLLAWLQRHRLVLGIAALTYIRVILSSPGDVGADTKTYLYLDPGGVLRDARLLWDSDVALGTVTHQNIGYLWPMGPFYWVFETLGSPDWFAQRIWLGSLLFAAAMGVRFLLRVRLVRSWSGCRHGRLRVEPLSPRLLGSHFGGPPAVGRPPVDDRPHGVGRPSRRMALPGTVRAGRAHRRQCQRNQPFARRARSRLVACARHADRALRAVATVGRRRACASGSSAVVSVWWIAGLVIQGRYSLPVTRYTETYEAVAGASTAPEILRGLGYWFFYGNDKFGAWIEPSIEYTQGVWLLFLTFGLVVLALIAATVVRWRHRSFFVALLVLGALIGIGSHPSTILRSSVDCSRTSPAPTPASLSDRHPVPPPMVVLATSVLRGTVGSALHARLPRPGRALGVLTLAAIVLANPAMWKVRMIEDNLHRDEDLPTYWLEATAAFDADDDGTRIWELPGSDFASYRWGNTVDPITPGLIDRGYVARELVPFGSAESADLLTAFDRRLQEGSLETASVVPIAQLMSVGDLVHRADLTYERFRTPRPVPMAAFLASIPGLGGPVGFGEPTPNLAGPEQTLLDEVALSIDSTLPDPAPVTSYAVPDPLDVVRLRSGDSVLIVVGDGEGLVDAAAAGALDLERTMVFGADLAVDDELREELTGSPAEIVITDSNRRRARLWGTLSENVGVTELAGTEPLRSIPATIDCRSFRRPRRRLASMSTTHAP